MPVYVLSQRIARAVVSCEATRVAREIELRSAVVKSVGSLRWERERPFLAAADDQAKDQVLPFDRSSSGSGVYVTVDVEVQ